MVRSYSTLFTRELYPSRPSSTGPRLRPNIKGPVVGPSNSGCPKSQLSAQSALCLRQQLLDSPSSTLNLVLGTVGNLSWTAALELAQSHPQFSLWCNQHSTLDRRYKLLLEFSSRCIRHPTSDLNPWIHTDQSWSLVLGAFGTRPRTGSFWIHTDYSWSSVLGAFGTRPRAATPGFTQIIPWAWFWWFGTRPRIATPRFAQFVLWFQCLMQSALCLGTNPGFAQTQKLQSLRFTTTSTYFY